MAEEFEIEGKAHTTKVYHFLPALAVGSLRSRHQQASFEASFLGWWMAILSLCPHIVFLLGMSVS